VHALAYQSFALTSWSFTLYWFLPDFFLHTQLKKEIEELKVQITEKDEYTNGVETQLTQVRV
jgi:hypothetical protein